MEGRHCKKGDGIKRKTIEEMKEERERSAKKKGWKDGKEKTTNKGRGKGGEECGGRRGTNEKDTGAGKERRKSGNSDEASRRIGREQKT